MSVKSGDEARLIDLLSLRSGTDYSELSERAYESAKVCFFRNLESTDAVRQLVEGRHSVSEVLGVVNDAGKRYKAQRDSKAYKWLVRVSEKVGHYGTVLDVLVQHHPEYVSLIWGTFKLLFGAICNHEEQVKQLAKTCAQIGNILENVEIHLKLYPYERLVKAVSELYVNILEFLKHAMMWYAKSRLGRAWTAISRPWELGFRNYVQDIREVSKNIVELVMVSSQLDLRKILLKTNQVHEELVTTQLQLERMSSMMQHMSSMQTQLQVNYSSSLGIIRRMEHNQILSLPMMAHLPAAGQTMNFCRTIRNRRRQQYWVPLPTIGQLEKWSNGPRSSVIFTLTGNTQVSQDFLIDSIRLIRKEKHHVVWAMRSENHWEKPLSCIDLIKVLVLQCLQINTGLLERDPFPPTVASFLEAADEQDWLEILNRVAKGLPLLYVALDVAVIKNAFVHDGFAAARFLERLTRIVSSTIIKVVLEKSAIDGDFVQRTWDSGSWSEARVDVSGIRHKSLGANSLSRRRRKLRRR